MADLLEKIKLAKDLKSITHEVPEWDVTIEIRAFSVRKRMEIRNLFLAQKDIEDSETDNLDFICSLLIESCFDPDTGEKIFNINDADWIPDKSGPVLDEIIKQAMEVNGLTPREMEKAESD